LEAVSPPGLHSDLDCEPRRQHRHVDASLPIFLLAIPAGALADIIDRRRS
jgi:Transmembrane secretion effector